MKFLIQTIDGEVVHDFAFTLIQQIKAHNEMYKHKNEFIEYRLWDKGIEGLDFRVSSFKEYIPMGSVEFVQAFIAIFYHKQIKPINIPSSLNKEEFLKRKIAICKGFDELETFRKSYNKITVFTKSNEKYKGDTAHLHYCSGDYWGYGINEQIEYFCSEPINIVSEWRGFVHRHKLLDLRNYSGDPFTYPDHKQVCKMMGSYEEAPVAYTIDVAILDSGETVLIEIHDFFSCGLYGFDHNKLPWMYSQWFHEFLKREL